MVMQDNEQRRTEPYGGSPLRGSFRSLVLGWTDPETGDRLTCSGDVSEGMLDELEPLGFEVLSSGSESSGPRSATHAEEGTTSGVRRLSLHARLTKTPDGRLSKEGA